MIKLNRFKFYFACAISIGQLFHAQAFAKSSQGPKITGYQAYTEQDWTKREIILNDIAETMEKDLVLYRWGSKQYAHPTDQPLSEQEFNRRMVQIPPGASKNARAGRGIYLST